MNYLLDNASNVAMSFRILDTISREVRWGLNIENSELCSTIAKTSMRLEDATRFSTFLDMIDDILTSVNE